MELIDDKFYWLRLKDRELTIGRCCDSSEGEDCWFDICGSDEGVGLREVEVFLPCIEFKKD